MPNASGREGSAEGWRALQIKGLGPVSRVAAVFQIGPPLADLPFASFKAKVIERGDGSFVAVLNVARRGPDGHPDGMAGLGDSIDEALEDALRRFAEVVRIDPPLLDQDFAWADPEEF